MILVADIYRDYNLLCYLGQGIRLPLHLLRSTLYLVPLVVALLPISYFGCGPQDCLTHFQGAFDRICGIIASDACSRCIPQLAACRRRRWQCRMAYMMLMLRLANSVTLFGNQRDTLDFLECWKRGLVRSAFRSHLLSDAAPHWHEPGIRVPIVHVLLSEEFWGVPTSCIGQPEFHQWHLALIVAMLAAVNADIVPAHATNIDPLIEYLLDHTPVHGPSRDHPIPWYPNLFRITLQVSAERVSQTGLLTRLWSTVAEH